MKLTPDDPKLTAYVLGELSPTEVSEIEKQLNNSAELRDAVAEIRDMTAWLQNELANETAPALSAKQRDAITATEQVSNVVPLSTRRVSVFVTISALAACVMFLLAWAIWSRSSTQVVAQLETNGFRYPQNAVNAQRHTSKNAATAIQPNVTPEATQEIAFRGLGLPVTNTNYVSAETELLREYFAAAGVKFAPPKFLFFNDRLGQILVRCETNNLDTIRAALDVLNAGSRTTMATNVASTATSTNTLVTRVFHVDGPKLMQGMAKVVPPSLVEKISKSQQYPSFSVPRVALAANGSGRGAYIGGVVTGTRPKWVMDAPEHIIARASTGRQSPEPELSDKRPVTASLGRHDTVTKQDGFLFATGDLPLGSSNSRRELMSRDGDYYRWNETDSYDRTTARYPQYVENSFESVRNAPLSTFSIDVDTASYANVRRFLNQNQLPPADAVRVEELVNYFSYNYSLPKGNDPFAVNMEVAGCPWNQQHRLVRVGLKGKEIAEDKRPPSNFVFLIDVSGSMQPSERLPLIKQALRMLVKQMTENDRIGIVVYAGSAGVVLESTSCVNKERILEALDRLEAGGSTNGGEGIQKAYALAEENFIKGGVNRVILATDGDFNVGISDQGELVRMIEKKAKSGVFLTALGVGTDNYKDALMQKLADKGNGNYYYLDTLEEAQKVLLKQMNGTLMTIAKDVKIQIEFNPARVQSYRLVGYEKRMLEAEDFNNDKKDAGEIGAGHTVTALYEIVPVGIEDTEPRPAVDDLKYQRNSDKRIPKVVTAAAGDESNELLTLKLRYKKPDGDTSKLVEFPLQDGGKPFSSASVDFHFAAAVAEFGMLLKHSQHCGDSSYEQVLGIAARAKGDDQEGYRAEFLNLVEKARTISGRE